MRRVFRGDYSKEILQGDYFLEEYSKGATPKEPSRSRLSQKNYPQEDDSEGDHAQGDYSKSASKQPIRRRLFQVNYSKGTKEIIGRRLFPKIQSQGGDFQVDYFKGTIRSIPPPHHTTPQTTLLFPIPTSSRHRSVEAEGVARHIGGASSATLGPERVGHRNTLFAEPLKTKR